MITSRLRREILVCIGLFLWPYIFLYRHVIPGRPWTLGIGNDFKILYYDYKVYLLDHLASGKMPLWSPSEGGGYPFWSNPFAQVLYPLNLPLTAYYKVTGGLSFWEYELFTISGIGIFAVGMYLWLRSLKYSPKISFAVAAIFSVSFKITELLRFPNAVHTAAWIPWLLLGIERRSMKLIFVATFFLLAAGYPYYLVYLPVLVAPIAVSKFKHLKSIFIPVGLCVVLLAPYAKGVASLLAQTTDRTGKSFFYSTKHNFEISDTWGSLVFPPAAQTEGWYYFSQGAFWVIVAGIIWTALNVKKYPGEVLKVGGIILWIGIISWITYGKESRLFIWLWENVPGLANLRVWGRMNIVLVPILAMFFATMLSKLENSKPLKISLLVLIIYGLVATWQSEVITNQSFDHYWISYFGDFDPAFFVRSGVAAVTVFLAYLWLLRKTPIILGVLVIVSIWDLGYVSGKQWVFETKGNTSYLEKPVLNLAKTKLNTFHNPRIYGNMALRLDHTYSVGYLANWYYKSYIDFLKREGAYGRFEEKLPDYFSKFMGLTKGDRLWFTTQIANVTVADFMAEARALKPLSYSGEKLCIQIEVTEPGFVSFIDNWDPDWEVWVNGQQRELLKLFGTFKSVRVDPGDSLVEFAYRPEWLKWLGYSQRRINQN